MGRERIGNVRLSIKGERRLFELLHGDCASLLLHHSSSYRVEMENSSDLSAGSIASFYNDDFEQNESRKSIFPWSKDLGNLSKKEKKYLGTQPPEKVHSRIDITRLHST